MLWKLRERVTAQVTDGASFFAVNYQSLKVLWAFLSLQARRKRFVGDIQGATGYIVTRDGPVFGSPTDEMSEGKLLKEIKVPCWLKCIMEVSGSFKAVEGGARSSEHRYRSDCLLC